MRLYFFTNRLSKPLTGGEIYNVALIEGAEKSLLKPYICEAIQLGKFKNNILICNIWYILKVIGSSSKDLFLIDTDLHARCFFAVIIAKIFFKRRLIGMLHHYNYWDKKLKTIRKIHYFLEKWISKCFDYLITNSEFSYANFYQITKNIIPYTILNPFTKEITPTSVQNPLEFRKENDSICFLHIGTIEHRKNLHTTFQALAELPFDFHFDIIGNFTNTQYQETLTNLVQQLSLESKITFHGFVQSDKINPFMERADAFILVSLMEGYGMVYAEAMVYGIPIIASNSGAIPELVEDGINGYLCDADDHTSIKNAIIKITEKSVRGAMKRNNLMKAKTFLNREQFIKKSTTLFDEFNK